MRGWRRFLVLSVPDRLLPVMTVARVVWLGACMGMGMATADAGATVQPAWLTIVGDPADASTVTIEVDPAPLLIQGDLRTLRLRVNVPATTSSAEGIAHRSYVSRVLFDCTNSTAQHLSVDFYSLPLWRGEPSRKVEYTAEAPRWLQLPDVAGDPGGRIVRAACQGVGNTAS